MYYINLTLFWSKTNFHRKYYFLNPEEILNAKENHAKYVSRIIPAPLIAIEYEFIETLNTCPTQ